MNGEQRVTGRPTLDWLLACADGSLRRVDALELRRLIAQLTGEIDQLHAGEEPYVHEYTCATPAQWIWLWNRAPLEQRLTVAEAVARDAGTARECFMGDHVNELVRLRNAWHEGAGRTYVAVALIRALACELDGESAWDSNAPEIANRIRGLLNEALNGPAPQIVPHAATPPPALLASTRFPAPEGCCPTCGSPRKEITS